MLSLLVWYFQEFSTRWVNITFELKCLDDLLLFCYSVVNNSWMVHGSWYDSWNISNRVKQKSCWSDMSFPLTIYFIRVVSFCLWLIIRVNIHLRPTPLPSTSLQKVSYVVKSIRSSYSSSLDNMLYHRHQLSLHNMTFNDTVI